MIACSLARLLACSLQPAAAAAACCCPARSSLPLRLACSLPLLLLLSGITRLSSSFPTCSAPIGYLDVSEPMLRIPTARLAKLGRCFLEKAPWLPLTPARLLASSFPLRACSERQLPRSPLCGCGPAGGQRCTFPAVGKSLLPRGCSWPRGWKTLQQFPKLPRSLRAR